MPPFLDELRSWSSVYSDSGGRRSVRVEYSQNLDDGPKRAAWITVEGTQATGQLTLWESGECDTEAHGAQGPILLRSRVLSDPVLVAAIADDLVDHVADYSGT